MSKKSKDNIITVILLAVIVGLVGVNITYLPKEAVKSIEPVFVLPQEVISDIQPEELLKVPTVKPNIPTPSCFPIETQQGYRVICDGKLMK